MLVPAKVAMSHTSIPIYFFHLLLLAAPIRRVAIADPVLPYHPVLQDVLPYFFFLSLSALVVRLSAFWSTCFHTCRPLSCVKSFLSIGPREDVYWPLLQNKLGFSIKQPWNRNIKMLCCKKQRMSQMTNKIKAFRNQPPCKDAQTLGMSMFCISNSAVGLLKECAVLILGSEGVRLWKQRMRGWSSV